MGIGKMLGGALCAVGAVIAAPVVLPALGATAIGTAVTGAAAAAGTAITSSAVGMAVGTAVGTAGSAVAASAVGTAAAAAGTAVAGAAAAAGTTVAGSAVGMAALGAASAVGSGVVTAAGAAGLAVAGSEAAIGVAVTSAAIGGATAVEGMGKLSEAQKIVREEQARHEDKQAEALRKEKEVENVLNNLGLYKLQVWKELQRFVDLLEKIQNRPNLTGEIKNETLDLTIEDMSQIKVLSITANEALAGGILAAGTGAFVGAATSGGIISSIGTASTGTAISSLSGAAAKKAAMAALGGGAKAAGGAGISGGLSMMRTLTVTPMLAVSGIMLNSKGKKALEDAEKIKVKVKEDIEKFDEIKSYHLKIESLCRQVQEQLTSLNNMYEQLIGRLEYIVKEKHDYRQFSYEERKNLEKTTLLVKLLKKITTQNLLNESGSVLEDEVRSAVREVKNEFEQTVMI